MRLAALMLGATGMVLSGCERGGGVLVVHDRPLSPTEAQAVQNGVRALMQDVAHDVTQDGPIAWSKHFQDTPEFFMAVNGQMAFGNGELAREGIKNVAQTFKQITLTWGDVRVDPLARNLAVVATTYQENIMLAPGGNIDSSGFFTAVVEQRQGRWQFRDVHWSVPGPPLPNPGKPAGAKAP